MKARKIEDAFSLEKAMKRFVVLGGDYTKVD